MIPSMSKQRLHEIRVLLNRAVDCERQAHALETEWFCGFSTSTGDLVERYFQMKTLKGRADDYLHMALELEAEHESTQRFKASQRCAA